MTLIITNYYLKITIKEFKIIYTFYNKENYAPILMDIEFFVENFFDFLALRYKRDLNHIHLWMYKFCNPSYVENSISIEELQEKVYGFVDQHLGNFPEIKGNKNFLAYKKGYPLRFFSGYGIGLNCNLNNELKNVELEFYPQSDMDSQDRSRMLVVFSLLQGDYSLK